MSSASRAEYHWDQACLPSQTLTVFSVREVSIRLSRVAWCHGRWVAHGFAQLAWIQPMSAGGSFDSAAKKLVVW